MTNRGAQEEITERIKNAGKCYHLVRGTLCKWFWREAPWKAD
jgi:hypothetical protein